MKTYREVTARTFAIFIEIMYYIFSQEMAVKTIVRLKYNKTLMELKLDIN